MVEEKDPRETKPPGSGLKKLGRREFSTMVQLSKVPKKNGLRRVKGGGAQVEKDLDREKKK